MYVGKPNLMLKVGKVATFWLATQDGSLHRDGRYSF
jgi:hypothetical protein